MEIHTHHNIKNSNSMKFFPLLLTVFFLASCGASQKAAKVINDNLYQHWVHSHEEDQEGIRVFRPANYNFPASRGREGFKIDKEGAFTHYQIGPNDVPKTQESKWEAKENVLVVTTTDKEEPTLQLQIVEVSQDILKIKK